MLAFVISALAARAVSAVVQEGQNQTVLPTQTSSPSSESPPDSGSSSQIAPIAGGVFALIVFLALLAGCLYWYYSNRKAQRGDLIGEDLNP
jgi:hypothetical protein